MANNFCIQCGNPIVEGSRFCTKCGAEVGSAAAAMPVIPTAPTPYDAAATAPMPTVAAASQPATNYAAPVSAPKQPMSATTKGIIVGVACAVVVIAVALLIVLQPWAPASNDAATTAKTESAQKTESSATATDSSAAESTSGKTESTAKSTESSTPAVADTDYTSQLAVQYDKLDGFHNRISDAAATFNADYVNGSSSTRSADASEARSLASEINSGLSQLDALAIPSSSSYYAKYQAIRNLYVDLQNRINVINEAWTIDLKYSDPGSHTSEITAPLGRDNDSSGVNRYKTDYVNNYEAARP